MPSRRAGGREGGQRDSPSFSFRRACTHPAPVNHEPIGPKGRICPISHARFPLFCSVGRVSVPSVAGRTHPHSIQALIWLVTVWLLMLGLSASAVVLPLQLHDVTGRRTTGTTNSTGNGVRLEFVYDGLSRRIEKKAYQNTSAAPARVLNNRELYACEGWNMVVSARRNNNGSVVKRIGTYVWGPDIASRPLGASSWQACGGVGGLLMTLDGVNAAVTYTGLPAPPADPADDHFFVCQDRLGNITGLLKAALYQYTLDSVIDYDPFGRELRASGRGADLVPFHYSSKFTDAESGLVYYGYRYYDPRNGRWLNRDPLGEDGGLNLALMTGNNPLNHTDVLGMQVLLAPSPPIAPRLGWGGPYLNSPPRLGVAPRFTPRGPGVSPPVPPVVPGGQSGTGPTKANDSPYHFETDYDPPAQHPDYEPHPNDTDRERDWKKYHRACDEYLPKPLKGKGYKERSCQYWRWRKARYERCKASREHYMNTHDTQGSDSWNKHRDALERIKNEQLDLINKNINKWCPPRCYPRWFWDTIA